MPSQRHHNIYIQGSACFWTSSVIDKIPILRSPTAAGRILEIWDRYKRLYNVKILGYVIMPDHIHLVVWSQKSEQTELFLEQTLRRTSGMLLEMTAEAAARGDKLAQRWLEVFHGRSKPKVWKERGHGFPITDHETFLQKLEYMHSNPVKALLVTRAEDYVFSSAAWYSDRSGPLEIDEIEW